MELHGWKLLGLYDCVDLYKLDEIRYSLGYTPMSEYAFPIAHVERPIAGSICISNLDHLTPRQPLKYAWSSHYLDALIPNTTLTCGQLYNLIHRIDRFCR